MKSPLTLSYQIDASDRLVQVNETWSDFARANGGEDVLPESVLGKSLWDFISDSTIYDIYRRLTIIARQGRSSEFRYRCDSPRQKRVFQMRVAALPNGNVEFTSTLLTEEDRPAISLLMPRTQRSETYVRICSWCHVVAWPGERWIPLELAAERVVSLAEGDLPELTHGICKDCADAMLATTGTPAVSRANPVKPEGGSRSGS